MYSRKSAAPGALTTFLRGAERWFIETALRRNRMNVAAAARQLGCNRTHLYELMRRHDIQRMRPPQRMTPEFLRFLGVRRRLPL